MISPLTLEPTGPIIRQRLRPAASQRRWRVAPAGWQTAAGCGAYQVDRPRDRDVASRLSIEETIAAYVASQPPQLYRGGD